MMSTVHAPSTGEHKATKHKATKIWTTFRKAAIQTLEPTVSFAACHPALLIIVSSSEHGLVGESALEHT